MPVFDDDRKPLSLEDQWKLLRQRATREQKQWQGVIGGRQVKRDDAWQNALLPPMNSVLLPLPNSGDGRTVFWWDEVPLPFFQQGAEWRWQTKDEYERELRRILAPWLLNNEDQIQAERRATAKAERLLLDANFTLMLPGGIYASRVPPLVDFVLSALCRVVDIDYGLIDHFTLSREQLISGGRPFAKVDIYLPKE